MQNAQIYCTANELMNALQKDGDKRYSALEDRIREACQYIARDLGQFIPVYRTRKLKGVCARTLDLGMGLLSITEVRVDGVAVTDYATEPVDRCWDNGPFTWLTRDLYWGKNVEIDGLWGLYDRKLSLNFLISQLAADNTIVVTDGSILSPGMILSVGTEQEYVRAGNGGIKSPAPTTATSLIDGAIAITDNEFGVDNGDEFHEGEVIQIGTEDLYILKIGSNRMYCMRGFNGTTKAAHVDNSAIGIYRTYLVDRAVNGTIAAIHTNTEVLQYVAPDDVHYLALEISGLMAKKAETSFGGRAGDANLGETFYINEFPKLQIGNVKAHYSIPYL